MLLMLLAQDPACSEPSIKLGIVINNIIIYGIKYMKCIMRNLMKDGKESQKRLTEGHGLVWGFGKVYAV